MTRRLLRASRTFLRLLDPRDHPHLQPEPDPVEHQPDLTAGPDKDQLLTSVLREFQGSQEHPRARGLDPG